MGDRIRGQGTDDDPLRKDLLSMVSIGKKVGGKKLNCCEWLESFHFSSQKELLFVRKDGICCSAIPSRLQLHLSECNLWYMYKTLKRIYVAQFLMQNRIWSQGAFAIVSLRGNHTKYFLFSESMEFIKTIAVSSEI